MGSVWPASCIEISRIKADISPQRGGPATVTVVRVTDTKQADLIVAGDVIESVSGLLNEGTCNFVDSEKTGKLLERLGPAYVFCAGVSKTEFQAVFSGVRYVPDSVVEKNVPFNRVASKKCLKWYTLRTNATRDERNIVLEGDNRCAECNQMYRRARSTSKRNLDIPLKERLQRTRPSSNYPMHHLSPRSKDIQLPNLQKKTKTTVCPTAQVWKTDMSLDLSDQQSQEVQRFVHAIGAYHRKH